MKGRHGCARSQKALTQLVNTGHEVMETGALTETKLYKCMTVRFLEHHAKVTTHCCLGLLKPAHGFGQSLIELSLNHF